MPTTFLIDKNSHLFKSNQLEKTEKRLKQYQQGIDKIVELNKNYNLDIYIADNGHNFDDNLHPIVFLLLQTEYIYKLQSLSWREYRHKEDSK